MIHYNFEFTTFKNIDINVKHAFVKNINQKRNLIE